MKEARDPYRHAALLGAFAHDAREIVFSSGGLFDKFMGDGFLAYWPFTPGRKRRVLGRVLTSARQLHDLFAQSYVPEFQMNSQSYPGDVGLGVGIDEGPASLVAVAGDTTIIGPAVVGAVRVVGAVPPGETIVNVGVGRYLNELQLGDMELTQVLVTTKDYEIQVAYSVSFGQLPFEGR